MKTCFFIGHRDSPDSVFDILVSAIERCITERGVSDFVVGGYGRFDVLAARAVIRQKEKYPEISLLRLTPYLPSERNVELQSGFDGTLYPPGLENVPRRFAIIRANRYMVDHSDCLIVYAWQVGSNATKLVSYARKREERGELYVENLAEKMRD